MLKRLHEPASLRIAFSPNYWSHLKSQGIRPPPFGLRLPCLEGHRTLRPWASSRITGAAAALADCCLASPSCAGGKRVVDTESESDNSLMSGSFGELARSLRDVRNTKTTHGSPLTQDLPSLTDIILVCLRSCPALVSALLRYLEVARSQREMSGSLACEAVHYKTEIISVLHLL